VSGTGDRDLLLDHGTLRLRSYELDRDLDLERDDLEYDRLDLEYEL